MKTEADPREIVLSGLYRALVHARRTAARPAPVPLDRIRAMSPAMTSDALQAAVDGLVEQGWVRVEGDGLRLDPDHVADARAVNAEVAGRSFGTWMVRGEASAAYRAFCAAVNGTDLVHYDMLDPEQLAAATEALALGPGQRAIDLGCGIGSLTEHLAASTGAELHGVDFAKEAIARARARSAGRGLPLSFEVGLLDDLAPEPGAWDAMVAFDTLYFVEDLQRLVGACLAGLRPGGRLVAFFTARVDPGGDRATLAPDTTPLGRALRALDQPFTTREFSAEEHAYWRRSRERIDGSEAEFAAEGNRDLWEGRKEETERILEVWEDGRARRYLYVALR